MKPYEGRTLQGCRRQLQNAHWNTAMLLFQRVNVNMSEPWGTLSMEGNIADLDIPFTDERAV
jgi:hypothetical protein